MDLKQVEELLDKYLDAATSLKEEEQLRAYFNSGEVAPHLIEYQALFGYFNRAREEQYEGKKSLPNISYNRKVVFSWVGIAASILLVIGLFLNQSSQTHEFGTYDDPEVALQKTKEALNFLSKNLNSGTQHLGYLQEFNNAKNEILKTRSTE